MVIGDQAEGGKGTVNKQVFCLLAGHPGRTLAQKVVQTGKEKLVDGRSRLVILAVPGIRLRSIVAVSPPSVVVLGVFVYN
jgi:hypothetical protein